jgi:cation:H+ antiporter
VGLRIALDLLEVACGLVLLLGGGRALVTGASTIARDLGVPPLVIGLTVVAFGTSAPELAVNLIAAVRGNGEIAFGNLIGSNLANVGLILGLAAMVRPLSIQSIVVTREIPMMLLASMAALVMGLDGLRGEGVLRFDRSEGLLLLLFFAVFLYYTVGEAFRDRSPDDRGEEVGEDGAPRGRPFGRGAALVVAGLAGLTAGGQLTVTGAVGMAEALAVPRAIIGLTLVALGTSLPELVTSVIAARQGEADLAVGNVVGSNVFNLLFVLPITATIHPVPIPTGGHLDLAGVLALSMLLWGVCSRLGGRRVTRIEGGLLVVVYLGYVVARAS